MSSKPSLEDRLSSLQASYSTQLTLLNEAVALLKRQLGEARQVNRTLVQEKRFCACGRGRTTNKLHRSSGGVKSHASIELEHLEAGARVQVEDELRDELEAELEKEDFVAELGADIATPERNRIQKLIRAQTTPENEWVAYEKENANNARNLRRSYSNNDEFHIDLPEFEQHNADDDHIALHIDLLTKKNEETASKKNKDVASMPLINS